MSDGQSSNCRNSRKCILGLGAVTQTPRNASTAPQYYFGAINAKLRCMGVNPFECGVIVLKRAGIMRLRSQPIVHGNDDAVAIYRDPLQPGQQPGVGHHEAAAMHVKQHRLALLRRRRINDPQTNLACSWRPWDMPLHGR
jgi:hypothetical protein